MREAENDPHDGKRKCEALWPIFRISHQKSRYIYDFYYRRKEISKELYEFCLDQGHADKNLIAKWKKRRRLDIGDGGRQVQQQAMTGDVGGCSTSSSRQRQQEQYCSKRRRQAAAATPPQQQQHKEDYGTVMQHYINNCNIPGYERLCCLRCIQTRDHNFATTCVCRVPKHLREEKRVCQW
uniref:Protein BUD31 homolog n=1 Tax=Oryza punctata TaxID=4537 RepID=A0A0E0L350_ORYPU